MTDTSRWSRQNICGACLTMWSFLRGRGGSATGRCRSSCIWSTIDRRPLCGHCFDAQSLYRVLRALASRGLFREDGDQQSSLTPLAEPLRRDAPDSIRPQALWSGSEAYRRTWGDLAYSVRTGEPAFDHVYGKPFFDYLAEQPVLAKIFNDVMTSDSSDEGAAIAAAHDFSGYQRIVDVGGGHGALLAAVLDRYPGPLGVLFDLPTWWRRPAGPSTGTSPPVASRRWQATSLKPCHPAGTPTC
jgi:hypothetical protein